MMRQECPLDCYTCDDWIECTKLNGDPEIETDENNRETCPKCYNILICGICCCCDYTSPSIFRDENGHWHHIR